MSTAKKHSSKKKFLALASALDGAVASVDPTGLELVLDAAARLKDMVADEAVSLSSADKVRLLKTFTRAKVRVFMAGTADSYRTFRTLETMGSDLVRML